RSRERSERRASSRGLCVAGGDTAAPLLKCERAPRRSDEGAEALSMERSDCWRRARAGAAQQYRAVGGGAPCPEEGAQAHAATRGRIASTLRTPRRRPAAENGPASPRATAATPP